MPTAIQRASPLAMALLVALSALSSESVAADDFGNTPDTATTVPSTGNVLGDLETGGDIDYFKFTVPQKATIRVAITPQDAGGVMPPVVRATLYDEDLSQLGVTASYSLFEITEPLIIGVAAKVYYLKVYGHAAPYRIELTTALDDHGNTRAEATPIQLNALATGVIDFPSEGSPSSLTRPPTDGDTDYFSVFVPSAGVLYPSLDRHAEENAVYVENSRGTDLSLYYNLSDPSPRYFAKVAAGRYFIRVNGRSGLTSYTLNPVFVPDGTPAPTDDVGSTVFTATPTVLPSTVAATMEFSEDVDVYRSDVSETGWLRVDATGATPPSLAIRDSNYRIVDGAAISTGMNGRSVLYTRAAKGRYFIEAAAGAGPYQLQQSFVPDSSTARDDHSNSAVGATPQSVGAPVQGAIDYPGDLDVFRLVITADGKYTIASSGGTDLLGWVATSAGVTLASNDNAAAGSGDFSLTASLGTGVYYLNVAHASASGTGPYQVSAAPYVAPPPVYNNQVVEYFHSGLGHYFITASNDEIGKLDSGAFAGWTRTGQAFNIYPLGTSGAANVCRFYSTSFSPKSSHFYTPLESECTGLKSNHDWQFEAEVFAVRLPDSLGNCGVGTKPVYRLYNNGLTGAPNHRYTTSLTIRTQMIAAGFSPEGAGPFGVVGCVAN